MLLTDQIKERFGAKILAWREHSPKRIYLSIAPAGIVEASRFLFKEAGLRFVTASGQETREGFEILYHFSLDETGQIVSLRVHLNDAAHPEIDSIAPVIRGAEWIEREMWELLGIQFRGHPNLTHLLLIDDWPQDNYPLRHDHES